MPASPVRVVLLDDHEIVRKGLRFLLEADGGIQVVGEAATVAGAEALILDTRPDVAVLDGRLPDGSGLDLCARLTQGGSPTRCLILTGYDDEESIMAAIRAGAAGYVFKEVETSSLVTTIRTVATGHSTLDPALVRRVLERLEAQRAEPEASALTEQQQRILQLIGRGLTNREIAEELHVAEKTVKNNVTRILAHLGVRRRTQAALIASRMVLNTPASQLTGRS